jgi:hypothetical protein
MKNIIAIIGMLLLCGCDENNNQPRSSSGVGQAAVKITVGSDGLTAEQRNISERLVEDNKIGSIKHLYVISAYSGQVLIYSTVRGKVTSGTKRLTPTTINGGSQDANYTIPVNIGGKTRYTTEVLQDDGTYGSSSEYIYWWDTKGVYHQHYIQGGQILHISDQPIAVKSVVINMELSAAEQADTTTDTKDKPDLVKKK